MKVKELLLLLQQANPELEIKSDQECMMACFVPIKRLVLVKADKNKSLFSIKVPFYILEPELD
jgi:hypothetical protein